VVKGNPSPEKFDTFHPDTMRRIEIVALIWIKELGKRRCACFAPRTPILRWRFLIGVRRRDLRPPLLAQPAIGVRISTRH